jgi:pyruvate kinase
MGIHTKIVATLGPERPIHDPDDQPCQEAVPYTQMIPWFVAAGVDVIRLNMAHRSEKGEREYRFLEAYRDTRHRWESQGRHVAILGDLQGPKIRLGTFNNDPNARVTLVSGKEFVLHTRNEVTGTEGQATVLYEGKPFTELAERVKENDPIWLGDGEALLEVRNVVGDGRITCCIHNGGEIKSRGGVTVQGVSFDLESFTAKDRDDVSLLLSVGNELTYIAVSFIKTAENLLKVKYFIQEEYRKQGVPEQDIAIKMPGLIAKIETQAAVDNIDEILDVANGVMVARGDLGMQIGLKEVAGLQKRIIHACNVRGKPVITATQMLDSMERHHIPTRAEVTDVYNAILDGTDAVMLSGESAHGPYPVQAIRMMRAIAEEAEKDFFDRTDAEERFHKLLQEAERVLPNIQACIRQKTEMYCADTAQAQWYREEYIKAQRLLAAQKMTDRVSHAACTLSTGIEVAAIMALTTSGQTAHMVARFRPVVPIVGAAHDELTARKLTLCFGVHPVNILRGYQDDEAVFKALCAKASEPHRPLLPTGEASSEQSQSLVQAGDLVVITAGHPLYQPGTTNLVKLQRVEE